MRGVVEAWWPLAASWLLMSVELPALSAVIARLEKPEIHLASYGAVIFPLALIIEAPVIMLLAASTALSKDWDSFARLRRFANCLAASLTLLHVLIAFTPLYYLVVGSAMGMPDEIVEAARSGLMIMTPWTWSIAYRRFNQGVLIRFGRSRQVGVGTTIRLSADAAGACIALLWGGLTGTEVAACAVIFGVVSEAAYIGIRTRPVLTTKLKQAPPLKEPLTFSGLMHFYIPLALTSVLNLVIQPFGSAAMSRMPLALESLAVWPVVFSFSFLLRSLGLAYQEVVVALLEEPGSFPTLRRFALTLAAGVTVVSVIIAATPLSVLWFETISGLTPQLGKLAQNGLWVALLLPALTVFRNWYQGILLHQRRTRSITESVVLFLSICGGLLWAGANWIQVTGLYLGLGAFTVGGAAQMLWVRSRSLRGTKSRPAGR